MLRHFACRWRRLVLTLLAALPGAAMAQAQPGTVEAASRPLAPGSLDAFFQPFERLSLASEVKTPSAFSQLGNAVFKPEVGEGTFPSIVVTHSCGGVDTDALREHMKELPEAGYQVGYSMGAFTAAVVASPSVHTSYGSTHRFRASVGWYGSCGFQGAPTAPVSHLLRFDSDRPVLLLRADADRETPVRPFCFPLMEDLKAAGKPVEWHFYGHGVTHAWDVRAGYTMTTGFGETVVNRADAEAKRDATQRTLAFMRARR